MTILKRLGDAPQPVRAAVCELNLRNVLPGLLWQIYETGVYDPASQRVAIGARAFLFDSEAGILREVA